MRADVPQFTFSTRANFREWLFQNAQSAQGVWLVFGKTKQVITLSANDALEEALCFGWIDGQMQKIDDSRYLKYFAPRRPKSPWSERNKRIVENLREKNLMTDLGENAIETAKKNGIWYTEPIGAAQVEALGEKLREFPSAHEGFMRLPPSARLAFTRRYHSFKGEEARQRDFLRMIDELSGQ